MCTCRHALGEGLTPDMACMGDDCSLLNSAARFITPPRVVCLVASQKKAVALGVRKSLLTSLLYLEH
jgi:hypothetical protein